MFRVNAAVIVEVKAQQDCCVSSGHPGGRFVAERKFLALGRTLTGCSRGTVRTKTITRGNYLLIRSELSEKKLMIFLKLRNYKAAFVYWIPNN